MQSTMQSKMLFILTVISLEILFIDCSITCKDQNGKNVDWFIVYKLPELEDDPNPLTKDGFGYHYMDVNNPEWTVGKVSLNTTGHALSFTLDQIYKNHQSKDVMYVLYNDETPEKNTSFTHGHTKGDLCFDKKSGFWLVHSLPRFPPYGNQGYLYPNSGRIYGQTFLCVTYNYDLIDVIGEQLMYTFPQIYDHSLPDSFHGDNPHMVEIINEKHVTKAPWNRVVTLTSSGGEKFSSFAKYTDFHADLYHDWLAPYYKSDVYVESWLNGRGSMNSTCTGDYKAYNIRQVNESSTLFNESHDHSKWAVTANGGWTCIGDINRQYSQEKRAGGTVCFNITPVWKQFMQSIVRYQQCPKPAQADMQLRKPYTQLNKPYNQLNKPYNQLDKPYKQLDKPYKQLNKPYKQLDKPYKQLNKPYGQLNKPYKQPNKVYFNSV